MSEKNRRKIFEQIDIGVREGIAKAIGGNNKLKSIESIRMPMEYLLKQFNLGEKIIEKLNGLSMSKITEELQALIEFHNQIMGNLYIIMGAITNGFPHPAAILAATVYELSHKAIYVVNNSKALKAWIRMPIDFKKEFDAELGRIAKADRKNSKIRIKEIVEDNVKRAGDGSVELEYGVYQQLCRFKHPHPIFCRLLTDGKNVLLPGSNRSDELLIQYSWYIAFNAARYAGYITQRILIDNPNIFSQELVALHNELSKQQTEISNYINLYHSNWKINPF